MDKRTKWSYCIGATGRDAAYALISMFLILYVQYTMGLTTAQYAVITGCMVVCMVWDAVNDLLMGIIIENTHMKMGKFKPWIIIGSVTNAAVIICLFTLRPSGWAYVVFFVIGYLCWGMTYTMNDIAYWGMLPSLSSDAKQRDLLVTIMSVFICIGQFSVAGIVPVIVAGNAVKAYRTVAFVVAISFVLFQLLTAIGVKERERVDDVVKLSIKDMYHIFARNDQLVTAGIASLLYNIGSGLLLIFGVNFFYVEYGYSDSGDLVFLFTVMYGLGMLISQALYATVNKKLKRKQILKICITGLITGYVLLFSFGYIIPKNVVLLNAIGFLIFFFQGFFNLVIIVMINNTIEYDEAKYSQRYDSVISAVRSFSVKLAGGINQGLSALVLIISGIYAMSQNISNLEMEVSLGTKTSDEVLKLANEYIAMVTSSQRITLRIGMTLIPIVCLLSAFLITKKKYHIDEEEYENLLLQNKKTKA